MSGGSLSQLHGAGGGTSTALWPLWFGMGPLCSWKNCFLLFFFLPTFTTFVWRCWKMLECADSHQRKSCLKPGLMLNILSSSFFSFSETTPFNARKISCPKGQVSIDTLASSLLSFSCYTSCYLFWLFPHWKKSLTVLCASPQQDSLITSSPSTRSQRASSLEWKILLLSRHSSPVKLPQTIL